MGVFPIFQTDDVPTKAHLDSHWYLQTLHTTMVE